MTPLGFSDSEPIQACDFKEQSAVVTDQGVDLTPGRGTVESWRTQPDALSRSLNAQVRDPGAFQFSHIC